MSTHVENADLDPLMQGEAALPDRAPLTPQGRVDASRAALQLWILRTYHPERLEPEPPPPEEMVGPPAPDDDPPWISAMVDALSDVPVIHIGARYLRRWWLRHPMYASFHMVDEAGRDMLRPIARSHPWLLLGGAVATGVAIGRLRPWRWVSRRTLVAGLVPPISFASILATFTALFAPPPDAPTDEGQDDAAPPAAAAQPVANAPERTPEHA